MPEAPRGPASPPHRRPPQGRGPQHPRPPAGATRAERRAAETRRSRPLQAVTIVALLMLLITAGFFFFRGDGGGEDSATRKTGENITVGDLELAVGGVYHANAGIPAQLSPELQNAVMTTVGVYLEGGVIDPVLEGEVTEDAAAVFDPITQSRLNGPDRAVIFEEGLPKLTGSFEPIAQPVILSALSDAGGNFVLVTATVNYSALFETEAGQIRSNRYHELTMVPSEDGVWRITSYDIFVIREGPANQTTTTTAAA